MSNGPLIVSTHSSRFNNDFQRAVREQWSVVFMRKSAIVPSTAILLGTLAKLSPRLACYVSMSQTYAYLARELENRKIRSERVFIIDSITPILIENIQKERNCLYLKSPSHMQEFHNAIKAVMERRPDLFIFDSLSCLLIYFTRQEIIDFLKDIMKTIQPVKTVIIVCLEKEWGKKLADISPFQSITVR